MTEKQKQYSKKYDMINTRIFSFKLNRTHDAQLIERLDRLKNKQGYLKGLIRDDIEKNGVNPDTPTVKITWDNKTATWKALCPEVGIKASDKLYDALLVKIRSKMSKKAKSYRVATETLDIDM